MCSSIFCRMIRATTSRCRSVNFPTSSLFYNSFSLARVKIERDPGSQFTPRDILPLRAGCELDRMMASGCRAGSGLGSLDGFLRAVEVGMSEGRACWERFLICLICLLTLSAIFCTFLNSIVSLARSSLDAVNSLIRSAFSCVARCISSSRRLMVPSVLRLTSSISRSMWVMWRQIQSMPLRVWLLRLFSDMHLRYFWQSSAICCWQQPLSLLFDCTTASMSWQIRRSLMFRSLVRLRWACSCSPSAAFCRSSRVSASPITFSSSSSFSNSTSIWQISSFKNSISSSRGYIYWRISQVRQARMSFFFTSYPMRSWYSLMRCSLLLSSSCLARSSCLRACAAAVREVSCSCSCSCSFPMVSFSDIQRMMSSESRRHSLLRDSMLVMYQMELLFFSPSRATMASLTFRSSPSCSSSICPIFSENSFSPCAMACCCELCTRSALRQHSTNSCLRRDSVSSMRRMNCACSCPCASFCFSNTFSSQKYFRFSIASFFSYSTYRSYSIFSFRPCSCEQLDCALTYSSPFSARNSQNYPVSLAITASFSAASRTSSPSKRRLSSSSWITSLRFISSRFFSRILLYLFFSARSLRCTSTMSLSSSSITPTSGLISQSLIWSCSLRLTNPSRLVSDTWYRKIIPSRPADTTYRPQGEVAMAVTSRRWALMLCSTMLSKTELKTLRWPSSVPASTAGMFHWLVSHCSLLTRKPPIANTFCACSFSIFTSRTTDFPPSTPDASTERAVFSYITEEYLALACVHLRAIHSLFQALGSPCRHSVTVPSTPTEKRARSSGFQVRSVMRLEWSLRRPISSRVQLLQMLMRWTLLFCVVFFWRGYAAARNCPPLENLRQHTPLTTIYRKLRSSFSRMWQMRSLSQQPTAMQQPRGCRLRQLMSSTPTCSIPSDLLSNTFISSQLGFLQFHRRIMFSRRDRVAKMGRCRQISIELISPRWNPLYMQLRISPSITFPPLSDSSAYNSTCNEVVAMAELSKAMAICCSRGHMAMLTTLALRCSPTCHLRAKSPVYSSSKLSSPSSLFIHSEKYPLLDPTMNPFENTQMADRARSAVSTRAGEGVSGVKTLPRCRLTSKLLPTGPTMKSSPRSVPMSILVLSNQAWAVKLRALGSFLTSSQVLKEQSSTLKRRKMLRPAQLMRWDWVGQIAMESVPSTVKLLTASPLLRLISRNMSWLSGSAVMQQAYLGCEGEKAMILKEDCFSVWGSLKCLIQESLFLRPQRLRRRKFQFLIFSQMAMWLRVGDSAMHSIVSMPSDSRMNYIVRPSSHCFTMAFPTVYTIFIRPSSSIIPISFLLSSVKLEPKAWLRSRNTFFSCFYIQIYSTPHPSQNHPTHPPPSQHHQLRPGGREYGNSVRKREIRWLKWMELMYQEQSSSLSGNARQGFVKKVYSVLSVQLLATVFMVWCNYSSKAFARYQAKNMWVFYVAMVGSILSLISLFLGKFTRSFPANYSVLAIFTLCESYMVSFICGMYTPESVLLSAVATLSATLGLTYHAMTTQDDYTSFRSGAKGMLYSLSWAALAIGLVNLVFLRSSLVVMGLAFLFAVIYSVYLVIDTQLILGGKNKELSLDDYILGSVIIYTDIIALFLKILQILGKKKDD